MPPSKKGAQSQAVHWYRLERPRRSTIPTAFWPRVTRPRLGVKVGVQWNKKVSPLPVAL